ncbi:MAG: glycerol-3-phosphate 1-O-acyltransferase PlsY [Erythrobacter sp.]|uniref:glycerol-3-phosphate 1-O-acyltransferase PlsY n=1 Tax=Erythrobacter sp. TaxID=1042 RepID=UPI00260A27D8|nr:glycerol-3-phosphate 1-O-acyltransferase PlsY [Erythrobacter sp.]MDJ0977337.1 glycerol-3-phosphate 1-O-acyltransferase PlsY [Erythrobacter sp.]
MNLLIAAALGFALGSIPFGLILTSLAGLGDVRKIGSGSIGATNVLRTGNKGLALATVLLDAGKGLAAVLLAGTLWPGTEGVAAVGAVAGHCYTPWLAFKGGKGFATAAGVCGALYWPLFLLCGAVWAGAIALTRTSSIASLSAVSFAAVAAFLAPFLGLDALAPFFLPFLAIQIIVVIKHNENIKRLFAGQEPKIGSGQKASKP